MTSTNQEQIFKTDRRGRVRVPEARRRELRLGQAIDYTLNLWPLLCVWLEDGRVGIDNNLVENAIRPTAIGKKNWLFIGEENAGERGAILYTIIESCRRRGIDPYAYLRDLLTRLPNSTNWQLKDPHAASMCQGPAHRLTASRSVVFWICQTRRV